MQDFFPRIQVKTKKLLQTSSSAQMQTRVKLLGGMQSNYWGEYILPIPTGFGTLGFDPRPLLSPNKFFAIFARIFSEQVLAFSRYALLLIPGIYIFSVMAILGNCITFCYHKHTDILSSKFTLR